MRSSTCTISGSTIVSYFLRSQSAETLPAKVIKDRARAGMRYFMMRPMNGSNLLRGRLTRGCCLYTFPDSIQMPDWRCIHEHPSHRSKAGSSRSSDDMNDAMGHQETKNPSCYVTCLRAQW